MQKNRVRRRMLARPRVFMKEIRGRGKTSAGAVVEHQLADGQISGPLPAVRARSFLCKSSRPAPLLCAQPRNTNSRSAGITLQVYEIFPDR